MASPQLEQANAMFAEVYAALLAGGPETSIDELREAWEQWSERFPVPDGVAFAEQEVAGIDALVSVAPGASSEQTILYLHGGGYVIGSARSHRALTAELSRATGARVVSLNYRMGPEHPHPAAVEDATAAYRAIVADGTSPSSIVIAGDSAGGGLTLATVLALRDAGDQLPGGAVGLSPWTDLALTGESLTAFADTDPILGGPLMEGMVLMYTGGQDAREPLISPLYGDFTGLPPLLLIVGSAERLRDDSLRVAERAREAGVDVTLVVGEDMPHVYPIFSSFLPEAQEAVGHIARFVAERAVVAAS